ncbi:hypothetical protein BROC_00743 [Candidatus Brocadiaceae bacterium]|nr:hypothetical protein BROC_00743 [Candidatus Brocadiaceae bacterium]
MTTYTMEHLRQRDAEKPLPDYKITQHTSSITLRLSFADVHRRHKLILVIFRW